MRMIFYQLSLLLLFPLFLLFAGSFVEVFAQQNETLVASIAAAEKTGENVGFTYSPKGRRDPFKPLVEKKREVIKKAKGRLTKIKGPLEKFELSQYRLIAIMVVKGVPRAMVAAPDGRSYTVKVGEYIGMNDGLVKKIETKVTVVDVSGLRVEKNPDRIVVEEIGIDSYTGQEVKENRFITM
ncbi:MAG: pilus assembly protein PilP [Thermodesulfobacteriota bacterium]|nr:pilus assembly protein PilP [Thermodesulfobacteriota bacterium]